MRRVPYLPSEVNAYGDVSFVKPGWIQIPLRLSRGAPKRYTIVVGWKGRPPWRKPVKEAVVPLEWFEEKKKRREAPKRTLPPEVLAKRRETALRKRTELETQTKEAQRNRILTAVAAHAQRIGCDVSELAPQLEVLLRYESLGETAANELTDLRLAHPVWLNEALYAAQRNRELGGQAYNSYSDGVIDFYTFLVLSRNAMIRHERTTYERLLASGYERDVAREFMEDL